MNEPPMSVIYEAKMPKKILFFRWNQGRGCWRWRVFWPEVNPFASRENLGGESEWVMLCHTRLTTTEVPLSKVFNPHNLLPWHCSLANSRRRVIYKSHLPGVNVHKNTGGKEDLCSENFSYIFFFSFLFFFCFFLEKGTFSCFFWLQTNKNLHI